MGKSCRRCGVSTVDNRDYDLYDEICEHLDAQGYVGIYQADLDFMEGDICEECHEAEKMGY